MIRFLVVLTLLMMLLSPVQARVATCDVGDDSMASACADLGGAPDCGGAAQPRRGAPGDCGPDLCTGAVVAVTGGEAPAAPVLGPRPAMPVEKPPSLPYPSRILRPPIQGML